MYIMPENIGFGKSLSDIKSSFNLDLEKDLHGSLSNLRRFDDLMEDMKEVRRNLLHKPFN